MNDFLKFFYCYFENKINDTEFLLSQVRSHINHNIYDELDCVEELQLIIKLKVYKEIQADFYNFFKYLH